MGEAVFISICIPAYSRVNYLKRLLDSILHQSYRHFEVVITDDSPDSAVYDLVHAHPLRDLVCYFKNDPLLGTPENWNESIRRAKGEWIKLMHDDDWFRDGESLEAFVQAIKKSNANFYFSAYDNVFPDGRRMQVKTTAGFIRRLNRNPGILLAANRIGPPSTVIFRNDPNIIFDKRFRWVVDLDFYMRYLKTHGPAAYIPKPLVCIGISETQVTQASFGNRAVEIPERFMLWEKMPAGAWRNLLIYDSWWRFIRNLKIKRLEEIKESGYPGLIPAFVNSMILRQNHIRNELLQSGPFSKAAMLAHYIIHHAFQKGSLNSNV